MAFQRASLAKRPDGSWEIGNLGELRTLRLDPALGWPVAESSVGVAGVRDVSQGRYVHLTDEREKGLAVLTVGPTVGAMPRLFHANGRARLWKPRGATGARVRVTADVPLEIEVAAKTPCRLLVAGKPAKATREPSLATGEIVTSFELPTMDTGEAELDCGK